MGTKTAPRQPTLEEWRRDGPLARWLNQRPDRNTVKLAETLGVSKQAICQWRDGETYPRPDRLAALAKALGISSDQWLKWWRRRPAEEGQHAS